MRSGCELSFFLMEEAGLLIWRLLSSATLRLQAPPILVLRATTCLLDAGEYDMFCVMDSCVMDMEPTPRSCNF